jgi:hypothetical protein
MINSGGDPQSLLLKLITGHQGTDPKTGQAIRQMPPTKLIDQQYIDMITQWVMAGMPQTAQDAAKAPTPTPKPYIALHKRTRFHAGNGFFLD